MKFERQFTESVEAERIPEDPRLSELWRIAAWADLDFAVRPDDEGHPTICWDIEGRIIYSWPGNWVAKDDEGCITLFEDADFKANFREITSESSDVLEPLAEYETDELPEWNHRPPVVAYG